MLGWTPDYNKARGRALFLATLDSMAWVHFWTREKNVYDKMDIIKVK